MGVLCAQPGVGCNLGIGAHGFSQGSHIASLSKKYETRVSGILVFGGGCGSKLLFSPSFTARGLIFDHSQAQTELSGAGCYTTGYPTSSHPTQVEQRSYRTQDIMRAISGVSDEFFGGQNQMKYDHTSRNFQTFAFDIHRLCVVFDRYITGYDCGNDVYCIQADGSGYYLIRKAENQFSEGDMHNFFRNGNSLTNSFQNGAYPWAMLPNLDWLAAKARGNQTPTMPSPPPSPPPPDSATAQVGEICAFNQQTFKSCVGDTSCVVSDYRMNPSGTTTWRSHCCRNNHWGWMWMCKYRAYEVGVVEFCRDDGQCDYNGGTCSGNTNSLPGNIDYGICSTSWLPDRVNYDGTR